MARRRYQKFDELERLWSVCSHSKPRTSSASELWTPGTGWCQKLAGVVSASLDADWQSSPWLPPPPPR